jgi:DNA-binding CsgD family transcriptional regulator
LLKDGKITLETYREIVAQLLAGGISPVEILIE